MHRGIYRGPYHNVRLKKLLKWTAEGFYDVLKGQRSKKLNTPFIIHLEAGGYIHISWRNDIEFEGDNLMDLFK